MQLDKRTYDLYLVRAQHELAVYGSKTKAEVVRDVGQEEIAKGIEDKVSKFPFGRYFLQSYKRYSSDSRVMDKFLLSLMENLELDEISFEMLDDIMNTPEIYDRFYKKQEEILENE